MSAHRDHAARALSWAILVFLVPLSPLLGSIGSVLASIFAILLSPMAFMRGAWSSLRRQPAMLIFLAVFAALALCFALTARQPQNMAYAANFLSLPLAAVVYLAALKGKDGKAAASTLAILCLAAALICALVALNDVLLLRYPRVFGFYMGPNLPARLALIFGFLGLAGMFLTRSPWRFAFYLGPLAGLVTTYFSGTRGAALALPPLALVFAAFLWADRRDRAQFWLLCGLAIASIAGLAIFSDRFAGVARIIGEVLSGGATTDTSSEQRLQMLAAAWQLFREAPLIGHGWANFAAVAFPYLTEAAVWGGPNDPFFQFHNDLANFAVAAGSVGILCLIALLLAPIAGVLATPRDGLFRLRLYCCLQLSAGYFVFGLTDFTFGYDLPTTLYAFLTAILLGACREAPAR